MKKTLICILFIICALGCTKTVYVPVERIKTVTTVEVDTVVQVKLETEYVSMVTKDTIARAETKYAEASAKWAKETLELVLENKDITIPVETKYIETTIRDSVPVPYPVEKVVKEKYTTWYDKGFRLFGIAMILVVIYYCFKRR